MTRSHAPGLEYHPRRRSGISRLEAVYTAEAFDGGDHFSVQRSAQCFPEGRGPTRLWHAQEVQLDMSYVYSWVCGLAGYWAQPQDVRIGLLLIDELINQLQIG